MYSLRKHAYREKHVMLVTHLDKNKFKCPLWWAIQTLEACSFHKHNKRRQMTIQKVGFEGTKNVYRFEFKPRPKCTPPLKSNLSTFCNKT